MERYERDSARRAAGEAATMLATDRRVRLVYVYRSAEDPDRQKVRDLDLAVLARPPFSFDEVLSGVTMATSEGSRA